MRDPEQPSPRILDPLSVAEHLEQAEKRLLTQIHRLSRPEVQPQQIAINVVPIELIEGRYRVPDLGYFGSEAHARSNTTISVTKNRLFPASMVYD